MVNWQNGKLTKWYIDKMVSWQNGYLTKWLFDKMVIWQKGYLTKWLFDKMVVWQKWNEKINRLVDKMTSCQNCQTPNFILEKGWSHQTGVILIWRHGGPRAYPV
jgi:hypothetical protein